MRSTVKVPQRSLRYVTHHLMVMHSHTKYHWPISKNKNVMARTRKYYLKNKGNAKRGIFPRLKIRPCDLDLWPWKSIGFQILLRSKHVPSLLILECSQGCYAVKIRPGDIDLWPMTLKINRVSDCPKDYACTKFGQNPLKDLDSSVHRMLCGKDLTRWPWPLTLKINRVPDSPKDYVCTKFGQNPLKDVDSSVHKDATQ